MLKFMFSVCCFRIVPWKPYLDKGHPPRSFWWPKFLFLPQVSARKTTLTNKMKIPNDFGNKTDVANFVGQSLHVQLVRKQVALFRNSVEMTHPSVRNKTNTWHWTIVVSVFGLFLSMTIGKVTYAINRGRRWYVGDWRSGSGIRHGHEPECMHLNRNGTTSCTQIEQCRLAHKQYDRINRCLTRY